MTPENFIYWLQGKLEIGDTKTLNEQEVQVIKDHLNLVLKKETPVRTVKLPDTIITPYKPIYDGPIAKTCSCHKPLGYCICNSLGRIAC